MEHPPYDPPQPFDRGRHLFGSGFKPRAVLGGFVADVVASFALTLATTFLFAVKWASEGLSEQEIEERISQSASSDELLAAVFLAGLAGSVLGGYVAGRIARDGVLAHAALVGGVGALLGLVTQTLAPGDLPEWYSIGSYVLSVPAALLGGWLYQASSATVP